MLWTGDWPAGREMKLWVGEWAFRGDSRSGSLWMKEGASVTAGQRW